MIPYGLPAAVTSALVPASEVAGTLALSAGRLGAVAAALLGLFAVVVGTASLVRAFRRRGPGSGRRGAVAALVSASTGAALAGAVAVAAEGGAGTGNGLVGAYAAMALCLPGAVLAGSALLVRVRRAA